ENERLAGEWLVQAHGLIYHLRQEPIVFFDFFDANNQRKPFQVLQQTGLTLPRLLHMGDAVPVETLIPLLNKKSHTIWTEEVPEGMVYRVERKDKVDFLAKWVRLDFQPGKYAIGVDDNKAVWNIFKE
ncbi:MAG: RNA ligase family protein, partial [Bacteroidota bacterium]